MSTRVNPQFKKELVKFGIKEWNECFHCGNCTATCPLTEDGFLFPRKGIRALQMGLQDTLDKSIDPWLCYYCGDCSDTCPRDANPGELMMALRRYLTSVYDWTGLSRKFYTSKVWEYGAIGFFALLVIVLFALFLPLSKDATQMVNASGGVMINSLVDGVGSAQFVQIIEYGDWLMAIIVASLLISNIFHMFYKVILSDKSVSIPIYTYFTEFWRLIFNFAAQPKFSKCDKKKGYWLGHFLLVSGYSIMFAVVVVVLPYFQTEEIYHWWHWQRLLGYYATFGILVFLTSVTIGRVRRGQINLKYSHPTDWLFIVMLGLTTISGILVHIFRINGMVYATYYSYIFHLAILVPMIMVEVPFSKWSHLAYRPFAIYFANLKKLAREKEIKTKVIPVTG